MLPMVVGVFSMSIAAGLLITKTGRYKIYPIIGSVVLIFALYMLSTIQVDSPYWLVAIYAWLFGTGLGLGMTTIGGGIEVNKETTARLMITGQADVIARSGNRAIVIDYKTGRGETQPADSNAQLRGLAVLVALWYRSKGITLDSVRVAIVAPWQGPPTVADFDAGKRGAP